MDADDLFRAADSPSASAGLETDRPPKSCPETAGNKTGGLALYQDRCVCGRQCDHVLRTDPIIAFILAPEFGYITQYSHDYAIMVYNAVAVIGFRRR